ncbi:MULTISPECIES: oligopeptide/dipeptide ABC transporter ATP-binding protein [Pseudomonas]|jgi:peptide/nickel transport system ATP-binding protein|uniref:oligopeptide/dipeptide ABC transporter ATP-binding protein n=1 Tax=Pseudomonas TaxID=286 RepID=UPI000272C17F|nr:MULTISPECIES: oligopeptide/dipeptide ABC transporter ATP-binding protein [Pseudomonas]MDP9061345.1 ATP-binding cassette domain-containing protein [Pseudomonadota bacterium]AUO22821.1 ABC transporter ATP-binding protein [Pseudomonas sp. NC02]EJF73374.1 oligopeptide/dipeptide ABC transporter ATP-binding protein [Pseudomonas sp. Ag1]MBT1266069.1 ABC transporter ATP-binding protein [Pseudomonas sp. VS38]MDE1913720.1 ABC transporter ATP-binding protein [Pseudomonas sp.]
MTVSQDSLLALRDVRVKFPVKTDWLGRPRGYAHALNGIDLQVRRGETLGIVGESGCGKSTLAQLLMGLVKPSDGEVDWVYESARERHRHVQIVFQDPQSSLDPRLPIWKIITEPLFALGDTPKSEMRTIAAKVAAQVGIRAEYLDRYPHQFSGGQRQRIAIARALASNPSILVLDEPTSALDISVQAQILNLLAELQRRLGLTYILISHNVSVVRHMADRVAVMYLGQIVELGCAEQVLEQPKHPYTQLLLEAVPKLGVALDDAYVSAPTELPGNRVLPGGCFFLDRCPRRTQGCERPQRLTGGMSQQVRCHLEHP